MNYERLAIRSIKIASEIYVLDIGEPVGKGALIQKIGKEYYFETEKEMVNWLRRNGWKINI